MGEITNQITSVSFIRMEDGTAEEYAFLTPLYEKCRNGVSDRLLELLKAMKGDKLGYQVDRYTHSLQSATRAESDGADEETVVCALLHDLGDVHGAGAEIEPSSHHVGLPGMRDAQLHVDVQLLGRLAVGDEFVPGEGGVLTVDPDIVVVTSCPDIGQLILGCIQRSAQSNQHFTVTDTLDRKSVV